ncbi:Zinc finger PHD-type [Penicillium atrosanguineum]|nr:Zinc finger PHD-type [Penicillium atrosanguineum]KAJ5149232.1 Zinc finger PHD-type [Penicillium atrosanguineum]
MSPRRSSRARTTQPSPVLLQHTNSSSSSTSLTRERSTRSNHKNPSPQGSSGHRSQSIEDAENGSKADLPHTRTRQRARDDDDEPPREDDEEDPEDDEEEEVTRCLCGQQEYPGLPLSRREALSRGTIKLEGHPATDSSDILPDDVGSMFIQCDSCKVWQHGGCVGIMDEETSPDEYFCEECRKDLHTIRDEVNGSRSSTYLPVAPVTSPAPSSRASSREVSRRSKDPKQRLSEGAANAKRRSTMNSRDAAYDEEELIRRAIEESKHEHGTPDDDGATQRTKRSRSEKTDKVPSVLEPPLRRQRPYRSKTTQPHELHPMTSPSRNQRTELGDRGPIPEASVKRNPPKEPEEVEPEVPETTIRRKERTNRRKGDESEQEPGSPTKTAPIEVEPVQASPDTPTPLEPTPARPSTRKSGRPPARRGGRVRNNQYTKGSDVNGTGTESPRRGQSHEIGADSPRVGYSGINGAHINGGDTGRPSKPRHMHPQRTTMNEMKRRVAAILEFISRMQVEMAVAGENSSTPTDSNGDRTQGLLLKCMVEQIEQSMPLPSDGESGADDEPHEKDFKELSSVEMMDVLTRHLLKWQQEFGKFGER